jgi:hypothetical protein
MSTVTQDAVLTPELVAQIRKLSRSDKDRLLDILSEDGMSDEPLPPISDEWKAEIRRRLEAIRRGEVKLHTFEETMAHLRELCAEVERR